MEPSSPNLCPSARLAARTLDAAAVGDQDNDAETSSSSALLLIDSDSGLVLNASPSDFLRSTGDDGPLVGGGEKDGLVWALQPIQSSWSYVRMMRQQRTEGNQDEEGVYVSRADAPMDAILRPNDGGEDNDPVQVVSVTDLGPCPSCADDPNTTHGPLLIVRAIRRQDKERATRRATSKKYQLMRSYVDASFDPMFAIDVDGKILMANDAASLVFGWTYEEFMGNDIALICGGRHGPHHQEYVHRYLKTGVSKIMGKKREVPAKRKDGTEFPVELGIKEIRPDDDADDDSNVIFVAFVKDLTHQKHHEHQLVRQQSLTKGMIDASFDPMFQIDESGIIHVVNAAAVALFGYPREELLGSNISIVCGAEHASRHDEYIQRYLKTGVKRIIGRKRNVRAKRKDGTEFDIELGVQEVLTDVLGGTSGHGKKGGGERMFCGYVRDMTRTNLDRQRIRDNHRLITGKFFSEDGTAGGGGGAADIGDDDYDDDDDSWTGSPPGSPTKDMLSPKGRPRRSGRSSSTSST